MSLSSSYRVTLSEPVPSDPPRFVVGGQTGSTSGDVKMYEWQRARGEMRLLGLQTDVGQIRAMAWSPLPTHRDLIAVGLSTGRTMVLSLSPQTLAVPLASKSGPDAAHSTTVATLALKNPRSSTCVAFSSLDPNYFATGYDRHRSDYSLLIWDLSSSISSLPADGDTSWQRPPDRLDIINPRAAQDPGKGEPRHIQHYGASEQVNDVAFLPGTYSILASTNNKAVRMFDLRSPSPGHTPDPSNSISMQWTTRAVSSLSPDPFSPHRFASYESSSSGSTVRLWDTRKAGSDILSLDIGGAILGIGWAPGGSGVSRLSVGTRDGINVWDVISGRTVGEEDGREWTSLGEMKQVIRPKQHLQSYTLSNSIHSFRSDVFFVLKDGSLNVGSLVNAPKIASGARGDVTIVSTAMTAIDSRRAGDVSPLTESTESDDEHGTITRANPFQLQPARVSTILAEAQNSRSASPAPSSLLKGVRRDATPGHEDEPRATGVPSGHLDWISWQRVLGAEISLTMQRRAAEGYGVANLQLNAAIATKYPGNDRLAGVWEFVDHLTRVMSPRTSSDRSVNLAHAGVYAIWTGQDLNAPSAGSPSSSIRSQSTLLSDTADMRTGSLYSTPREPVKQNSAAWASLRHTQHQMPARSTPNPQPAPPTLSRYDAVQDQEFSQAVEGLSSRRDDAAKPRRLPPSSKSAQRNIILSLCGDTGSEEITKLIEEGHRTKASCLAYFTGEVEYAVRILLQSHNSGHRLLGTTLAGFLQNSQSARGTSSFFDEHWQTLVNRVDDPYMRVVLNRIAGEGWETVQEEEAIPLLDRTAILVHHLNDQELADHLANRFQRFHRNTFPTLINFLGLLGFTSPTVLGLQRWLERTGDIQTVALLSIYFPSSRLSSRDQETVRRWIEAYRSMLDSWGMWSERIDFDTRRMEIGKTLGEERVNEEDRGTSKGICPVCNNALSKAHEEHLSAGPKDKDKAAPKERQANCTFCGQALPRCVICLKHVESTHRDDWDEWMDPGDTIDQAYVCCLTCRHGGHACHILPWFEGEEGVGGNSVCPVSGCDCNCADI